MRQSNDRILIPYVFGTIGMQTVISFAASFQTEFYNKMYSALDPNILAGCALILFVSKIISSVLDPVIGVGIDKAGRNGSTLFQWIRRSIFPLAFLTFALFIYIPFDRFGGRWLMYVYITLTSVLWSAAMSFAEIPTQSMISYLSKNDDSCRRLAAMTNIAKSFAQGAPPVMVTIIMLLVDRLRGIGNTSDSAYYLINVSVIVLIGVLFMSILANAKPSGSVQTTVDHEQASVTIPQMLADLRRNKNVLIVFLINFLGFARNMSNVILLQANGAFIGKVDLFGRSFDTTTNATWLPYVFGNVSATVALFIVPMINRRLKEKKTYILFSVLDFLFSMSAFSFYMLLGADSSLRYGIGAMRMIMVFSFIGSFLMGVNQYIPLAMTAEISNAESRQTGSNYSSAPYAVLTMSVKLGTALCTFIGLLIVSSTGYNNLVYEAGQITPHMQNIIMLAFMAIPGISTLISAVPAFFYKAPLEE